ncbi:plant intracellular Ras-group-related LRR protein 4-like [Phalaenopsis equestris]|uniref:plant intracellular Ras-group-related LRR protein 4-like n=2 Tax=Phalaenopsis equestris TaxID=78828 RepID=UPI0009E561AF|nr:plant intracellular Ras-group-related LRR protein 4-like [Phalaenopsis equestris]
MNSHLHSSDDIIKEITRLHCSLLPQPPIDEVEAAMAIIGDVDGEERSRLEAISKQSRDSDVPEELFFVFQEMQRSLVRFQCKAQRKEAMKLLDLESVHQVFDDLIQRASKCIPLLRSNGASFGGGGGDGVEESKGDCFVKKGRQEIVALGEFQAFLFRDNCMQAVDEHEKLSLIKLASLIELALKKGTRELNLQNRLMDDVDWLPSSIGKLSFLTILNLSENSIHSIPTSVGSLSLLRTLDVRANQITELPKSIGDLLSLCHLNLRGNQLTSLPPTIGKLVNLAELDLSSNRLSFLPDSVGHLINLKKLNMEANNIEELPHTIGNCNSLAELRADYNCLKCLPEAIGRLSSLEILSVRYNNIKGFPTTIASLSKLKEVDASFNELESIPESLCLVTTLVRLNVSNNFADLQLLPRAIGNLEVLEELDISNNQIKVLPDSFGMLTQLCVLQMEENPLEVPPRHVANMGAQAVVHYMAEMAGRKAVKSQAAKLKKTCSKFSSFSNSRRKKHHQHHIGKF